MWLILFLVCLLGTPLVMYILPAGLWITPYLPAPGLLLCVVCIIMYGRHLPISKDSSLTWGELRREAGLNFSWRRLWNKMRVPLVFNAGILTGVVGLGLHISLPFWLPRDESMAFLSITPVLFWAFGLTLMAASIVLSYKLEYRLTYTQIGIQVLILFKHIWHVHYTEILPLIRQDARRAIQRVKRIFSRNT